MVDKVLVAITGASGSIYAERLIQELLPRISRLYVIASETARAVVPYELKNSMLTSLLAGKYRSEFSDKIKIFSNNDIFAPVASGSSSPDAMVVIPCSMGTLARLRTGVSQSLIERAADVIMKESKGLILCPRETPFSVLHLENMLFLAKMGVKILPPNPAFYQKPETMGDLVDFVTGKVLEAMGIEHELYSKWNEHRC